MANFSFFPDWKSWLEREYWTNSETAVLLQGNPPSSLNNPKRKKSDLSLIIEDKILGLHFENGYRNKFPNYGVPPKEAIQLMLDLGFELPLKLREYLEKEGDTLHPSVGSGIWLYYYEKSIEDAWTIEEASDLLTSHRYGHRLWFDVEAVESLWEKEYSDNLILMKKAVAVNAIPVFLHEGLSYVKPSDCINWASEKYLNVNPILKELVLNKKTSPQTTSNLKANNETKAISLIKKIILRDINPIKAKHNKVGKDYYAEIKQKLPNLGKRQFNRAWKIATQNYPLWQKSGRKKNQNSESIHIL